MKIFKSFIVLLLAFSFSAALYSAEAAAPQADKKAAAAEPGFFARLFGAKEEAKLTRPEPWNKQLIYNAEDAAKPEEEPNFMERTGRAVGIYLANVGSDLLDIFGMEVSFGNTFALDLHVTSLCDFGVENTDAYFAGFGPRHYMGAGRREAQRVAALCWSYEDIYVSQTVGKMPSYSLKDTSFNLVRSYTEAYTNGNIDYLAIGGKVAMIVGFSFDLHLAAIPDFFASLAGRDFYGDNWK